MEFIMASFTIRYLENKFQLNSYTTSNWGGYGYVEVILTGVDGFRSRSRGKKFFWQRGLNERRNPFDDCIAYLGKLSQGKWLTEKEYEEFTSIVIDAWRRFDALEVAMSDSRTTKLIQASDMGYELAHIAEDGPVAEKQFRVAKVAAADAERQEWQFPPMDQMLADLSRVLDTKISSNGDVLTPEGKKAISGILDFQRSARKYD